jgi:hypothetical protein
MAASVSMTHIWRMCPAAQDRGQAAADGMRIASILAI